MTAITMEHLQVQGIDYLRILDIEVNQKIGQHAYARLVLELENSVDCSEKFCDREITLSVEHNASPVTIFTGIVQDSRQIMEQSYTAVCLELASKSILLDKERKTQTFQQTGLTHEDIMLEVIEGRANLLFGITDKAIGSWSYRNNETCWEYVSRLASQCEGNVFTNVNTKVPTIYIGASNKYRTIENAESETNIINGNTVNRTYSEVALGDIVGANKWVYEIKTYLLGGVLVSDYVVMGCETFKRTVQYNERSECRMLTGTVKEVDKEKVKVFFDSIDSSFDESGDMWFEYATPYSSPGGAYGSGFYVMPEVGDSVRVFLPAADEGTAFAFGSVSVSPLDNPKEAKWRVPGGQEILFTKDGVKISCKDESVYINMKCDTGIEIWSDKSIHLEYSDIIALYGKKGVTIFGENEVDLNSDETHIRIQDEKMVINGENIRIN